MTWVPLLDGVSRERAHDLVANVVNDLTTWLEVGGPANRTEPGHLQGGGAGIALLFREYYRLRREDAFARLAAEAWGMSARHLATGVHSLHLFSGITGVAWAAAHVREEGADDDLEDVDALVENFLASDRVPCPPDLIGGLTGIGLYLVERVPRAAATRALTHLLDHLERASVRTHRGDRAWPAQLQYLPTDYDRSRFQDGGVPLGVAHGMTAIIVLLAKIIAAGVDVPRARMLFDEAVSFMLSTRYPPSHPHSFPAAHHDSLPIARSTFSWCWGDPGTTAALLNAGRRAGHAELEREMVMAARKATAVDPLSTGLRDESMCHGYAGVGHIFNRLFQATRDEQFRECGLKWFDVSLSRPQGLDGFGGLLYYHIVDDIKGLFPSPGLLTGSAGTALALISAIGTATPVWDMPFCVDIPHAS